MTIEGGCRCGAVRYRIDVAAMPRTYACHCTICQRATGSSFAHQMPIPEASFGITGETVVCELIGVSGATSLSYHCGHCFSRIYNTNSSRPGLAVVRAGTVDGGEHLSPMLHIFTSTKQPWIDLPDDVEAYPELAPMDAWSRLFSRA
jgi:hypothetical protein